MAKAKVPMRAKAKVPIAAQWAVGVALGVASVAALRDSAKSLVAKAAQGAVGGEAVQRTVVLNSEILALWMTSSGRSRRAS